MKIRPPQLILGVTALVAVIAVVVLATSAGNAPGASRTEGSRIIYKVADGTADGSIELPINLQEGNDAAHESEHVFERVAAIPGAIEAVFDTESLVLTVGYDSSATNGATIRQELYMAGYTSLAREDATPAQIAIDGASQRIEIAADGGLSPRFIAARAGLPLELVFSAGTDCLPSISLPELSVTQDISQGGTITLPTLEPGTYALVCGQGALEGTLVVE